MADLQEENLLESCPRCGYSLKGLPTQHRCPECGLPVDRRWRVFGGRTMRRGNVRAMRVVLGPVAFVLGYVVLSAGVLLLFGRMPRNMWYMFLIYGTPLAAVLWYLFSKPKGFVAVGPDGLAVHYRGKSATVYPWADLGRAQYVLGRGLIEIPRAGPTLRLRTSTFFRGNTFEVDACVQAINSFARGNSAGKRPTPTPP